MPKQKLDRSTQDVGNILSLEHVNVTVPDQLMATTFYVNGLGLTRDPYIDFGPRNVWVNAGDQQFHLPTSKPQVLRGHTALTVPSLDVLEASLMRVGRALEGTRFAFKRLKSRIDVTCPWGNKIRCFGPTEGGMALGIPYVELNVPVGTTKGIARFYNEIMGAPANAEKGVCTVSIGTQQTLRFRETKSRLPDYDGHHLAIYLSDFSGPWKKLRKLRLISEESDDNQYRFINIVDPANGKKLFEIEHEVRSLFHPMYARRLTNRNPAQTFMNYRAGRDAFVP